MKQKSRSAETVMIQLALGAILGIAVLWFLSPYLMYVVWVLAGVSGIFIGVFVHRHVLHNDLLKAQAEAVRAQNYRINQEMELHRYRLDQEHTHKVMELQAKLPPLMINAPQVVEADSFPPTDVLDLCNKGTFRYESLGQFLATGMTLSGSLIHLPLGNAGHIALAGSTGNGKTNALRWILSQLVSVPAWRVYYISPAFARLKANGEDWGDIHRLLSSKVSRSGPEIQERLTWGVGELARRMDAEDAGDISWATERIYIVIDEYKEVVARYKGAPDDVGTLLRMGRQYEIFLIVSAQDFLIKNIGGDSGARDSYSTVMYFGGDPTTCRSLLGDTVDEAPLVGDGFCYLKGRGPYGKPVLVRLPYASNEGIDMITRSFHDKEKEPPAVPASNISEVVEKSAPAFTEEQEAQFLEMYKEHKTIKGTLRAMKIGNSYYKAAKSALEKEC